jgi:hypothetical protein
VGRLSATEYTHNKDARPLPRRFHSRLRATPEVESRGKWQGVHTPSTTEHMGKFRTSDLQVPAKGPHRYWLPLPGTGMERTSI